MRSAAGWLGIGAGLAWVAAASGCIVTGAIEGNGDTREEERDILGFDGVAAESNVDVEVEIDAATRVAVTCDANLLRYIETFVDRHNVLVVTVREGTTIRPRGDCYAYVRYFDLRTLEASGSGDIDCRSRMPQLDAVVASGSGDIYVRRADGFLVEAINTGSGDIEIGDIEIGEVQVTSTGSGTTAVAGISIRNKIQISGSGPVLTRGLESQEATVDSSGSGDTEVFASDSIDVVLTGSGDVDVWGSPATTSEEVTGSGSVTYH